MKKNPTRLLTILAVLTIMLLAGAWVIASIKQDQNQETTNKYKTLRESAKERDIEATASQGEFFDIKSLAKASNAIVLGRVTDISASFTETGQFITTTYTIDVQRVLKDTTANGAWRLLENGTQPAPLTTPLKVTRLGGIVNVDGHRASLNTEGEEPLKTNKDYIMFLHWSSFSKSYELSGGASGTFLIKNNQSITPTSKVKEIREKYDNFNLDTFINLVLQES